MLDLEAVALGAALVVLVGAAFFAIWSCCQTALHFRSADNIFERTRKRKVVEFDVRGRRHRFEFEQQYREAGMGVGSAVCVVFVGGSTAGRPCRPCGPCR